MPLTNQKCEIQPTLINPHPNEYKQEFHYYPFAVKLDICLESCNTLNDLSNKNELKILTKNISCKCNWRFDKKKSNSNQWWNNDKCRF